MWNLWYWSVKKFTCTILLKFPHRMCFQYHVFTFPHQLFDSLHPPISSFMKVVEHVSLLFSYQFKVFNVVRSCCFSVKAQNRYISLSTRKNQASTKWGYNYHSTQPIFHTLCLSSHDIFLIFVHIRTLYSILRIITYYLKYSISRIP